VIGTTRNLENNLWFLVNTLFLVLLLNTIDAQMMFGFLNGRCVNDG